MLSIAIGLWVVTTAFLSLRLTTPSDGAFLKPGDFYWNSDGLALTPLTNPSGGLRSGDVVVAVEGRSMESWAQALFQRTVPRPRWQFGQTAVYTVERADQQIEVAVELGRHPLGAAVAQNWSTILFGVVNQLVAAFVFWKRPRDRAAQALFLGAAGMSGATVWSLGLTIGDIVGGIGFWLFKVLTVGAYTLFFAASFHFALAFCDFRTPRPAIFCMYTIPFAFYPIYLAVVRAGAASTLDWLRLWIPGEGVFPILFLVGMISVTIYGYRTRRDPVVRRRIRWVIWATLVSGGAGLVLWLLPDIFLGRKIIGPDALGLIVLPVPLALAAAILRHRLFDIDVLLNRTLVYGSLTAGVIAVYVLIVGYLGMLFHVRGEAHALIDLTVSLFATGLVAVLFQPLRERLQRAVNRWMYGERDDPYTVLSRLGQRLEATLSPDAVLSTIVTTVAEALKLPYAAIALGSEEPFVATSVGTPVGEPLRLPLAYQNELVGQLILAPRAPKEAFTPRERRLLEDMAHQAGVAAYAARLTVDLQRSRERLVLAREEERRRLRRDLHDDLAPTLAALALTTSVAKELIAGDPKAAEALLSELHASIRSAVGDIRRLVYDLRPPALDDWGLVAAVQERAGHYSGAYRGLPGARAIRGLQVSVEAPPQLPALPAAVEVAAYRIIQEAIHNVARHASAKHCMVRLSYVAGDDGHSSPQLYLEISDDGPGLPKGHTPGVGLRSMRERAAELGGRCTAQNGTNGGTRVCAWLPIARDGSGGTAANPDR